MSKKQKKMLIRIIAAGAIWAIGFAVEHIFPTDGYPVESYPEHRARSGV